MGGLRDFFQGAANALPQGLNAYQTVANVKQGQQALDQRQQQFDAGFLPGSEANNRITALFPEIKLDPVFDPNEKVSVKELDDALNVLQSRIPGGGSGRNPYFSPKGITPEGKQVIFDHRTGQYIVDQNAPTINPQIKTLPASDVKELGDTQSLEDLLNKIDTASEENPNLLGRSAVIEGVKLNPLVKKVQSVTGIDTLASDPKSSEFLRDIQSLKTMRSFSLGGKQLTPTEVEQLSKLVPNPDSTPEDFRAQKDRFRQEMERIVRNRERGFAQAGYTTPNLGGGSQAPQLSARERLLQKMQGR